MNRKLKLLLLSIILVNVFAGIFFFLSSRDFFGYSAIADNVLFVIIVIFVSYFLVKAANVYLIEWFRVRKGLGKTPQLINRIISIIIYIIALIIILRYFKVEVTPILAALGILGLALGLALQPTLSNLFAGLQILANKPIRVGDYVEIGGFEGYVEDIGWRSVRIKTLPNNTVIIPNSKLMESTIVNDSLPQREMAVLVQVGVDYSSDLKKVEKITIDTARKMQQTVEGAITNFEPFIRYHTFADNNIEFTVILRVKEFEKKYLIKHEFIKALKERYDKEGIEISWPIRKVTDMDKPRKRK